METTKSLLGAGARGALWLGGGQVATQATHIVLRLVLARLVAPEAFGVVAMAMAFVSFADLLGGLGFGQALIQRTTLSEAHRSTAFWTTLGTAAGLVGLALLASPLVGAFFRNEELIVVFRVLATTTLLTVPLGVYESLFIKDLSFRSIATRKFVATAIAGIAGIALALMGAGVWSIVVYRLIATGLSFLVIVVASPWHPTISFSMEALADLWRFGSNLSAATFVAAMARQLPTFLIGGTLGATALGYFGLANQTILTPLQFVVRPIAGVAFPIFSRLRDHTERVAAAYAKVIAAVTLLVGVIPGLVIVVGPEAVILVLGEPWRDSLFAFRLFAAFSLVRASVSCAAPYLLSLGMSRFVLLWNVVSFVVQAAALGVGVMYGFETAVAAWVVAMVATFAIPVAGIARFAGVPVRTQLAPLGRVLVPVVLQAGTTYATLSLMAGAPPLLRVGIAALVGVGVYAAAARILARDSWEALGSSVQAIRA